MAAQTSPKHSLLWLVFNEVHPDKLDPLGFILLVWMHLPPPRLSAAPRSGFFQEAGSIPLSSTWEIDKGESMSGRRSLPKKTAPTEGILVMWSAPIT